MASEKRILEDMLGVIRNDITDAVSFINDFSDDFEKADRYYNGEVDLPSDEGRSRVVSTQVRDAIRNMRPSIMRVLCSNRRKIVRYNPTSIHHADAVEQQTAYVHQLFWANGGYTALYAAVDESLRHKFGPMKTYWEEKSVPTFHKFTMLTLEDVQQIKSLPDVKVLSVKKASPVVGNEPVEAEIQFFDLECLQTGTNGRIVMQPVPYGEFFISKNANDTKDARVHGHRRSVTVSEAIAMGLEHDDWTSLDDDDPQQSEVSGQASEKRGYYRENEPERGDEGSHRFLLTEAYVQIDLHDVGYPQLYCLYLGGSSYELISYYRETESPFDIYRHDILTFSPVGYSVADVTANSQDVITSMLRGMVDNVHMANTPRLAGNPQQINFDDLMNHSIGHPIRLKGTNSAVQVVAVPSQIQSTLPMLQWLEQDASNKVGVTKAAQGLDPNAMQSTDKEAVKNTIMLSQGQVELAVRNLIETGVVGTFRKLLRLSIEHMDRVQVVKLKGAFVPVDLLRFNADLYAEPEVGLGTATEELQMMGLQATLQTQMGIVQNLGVNNPFTSISHIYNTLEDLTSAYGLYNVGRYYNLVTPEVEKQFAEAKAQEAAAMAQQAKPADPGAVILQTEQIKAETKKLEILADSRSKVLELKFQAMQASAKDDLERDKMAQDRQIAAAELLATAGIALDQNEIKREQAAPRKAPSAVPNNGEAGAFLPVDAAPALGGLGA